MEENCPTVVKKKRRRLRKNKYLNSSYKEDGSLYMNPSQTNNILTNEDCSVCGELVEMYNDDVTLSKDLHSQRHKTLETVNALVDQQNKQSVRDLNYESHYLCTHCGENVKVLNHDKAWTMQVHNQIHDVSTFDSDCGLSSLIDDDISVSEAGNSNTRHLNEKECQEEQNENLFHELFASLEICLQSHRGFITKKNINIFCTVCTSNIKTIDDIAEHLITKAHEDNIILCLKQLLPSHLQHTMEFISLCDSNLFCNLCRCGVKLASANLFQSCLNIIAHVNDSVHLNKRSKKDKLSNTVEIQDFIQTLEESCPIIYSNKQFLEVQLRCGLCNESFDYKYDQHPNSLEMLKAHFQGSMHLRSLEAVDTLKLIETQLNGRDKYSFVRFHCDIVCKSCNSTVPSNFDKVLHHIQAKHTQSSNNSVTSVESLTDSSSFYQDGDDFKTPANECNIIPPEVINSVVPVAKSKIEILMEKLSEEHKPQIIENDGHLFCIVCKCEIPITWFNLYTHVKGIRHGNNEHDHKISEDEKKSYSQIQPTLKLKDGESVNADVKESNHLINRLNNIYSDQMCAVIEKNNPVVEANKQFIGKGDRDKDCCKLCNSVFSKCSDVNTYLNNIIIHFQGKMHRRKVRAYDEEQASNNNLSDFLKCMAKRKRIGDVSSSTVMKNHLSGDKKNYSCTDEFPTEPSSSHKCGYNLCNCGEQQVTSNVLSSANTIQPLLQRNSFTLMQEMFESLPPDLQNNCDQLITNHYGGHYWCLLCQASIVASQEALVSHLQNEEHRRGLLSANRYLTSELAIGLDSRSKYPTGSYVLQLEHPVIEANAEYITEYQGNASYCTLCGCIIPYSENFPLLTFNVIDHFLDYFHLNTVFIQCPWSFLWKSVKGYLTQISLEIQTHISYFVEFDRHQVCCLLCRVIVPKVCNNILNHIRDKKHLKLRKMVCGTYPGNLLTS